MPDAVTPVLVGPLVEQLLHSTMYWLSEDGRSLVSILVAWNGRVGSMRRLTASLGLRSRHQLTRLLARENLPSLECLTGWIRVLLWVTAWERNQTALARGSLIEGHDPAIRFRTVKRIADCTWGELKARGSVWAILELQTRCLAQVEARTGARRSA